MDNDCNGVVDDIAGLGEACTLRAELSPDCTAEGILRCEPEGRGEQRGREEAPGHEVAADPHDVGEVRQAAEAHGADIDWQSQPGEGTRFTVTIPLEQEA